MERGKRKLDGEMGRRPVIKDLEAMVRILFILRAVGSRLRILSSRCHDQVYILHSLFWHLGSRYRGRNPGQGDQQETGGGGKPGIWQ